MRSDMLSGLEATALLDDDQLELLREALDKDELAAMLAELPGATSQALGAIEMALKAGDIVEVRRAAHVLKGVASSFGAARLASIARAIELDLPSIADVAEVVPHLFATAKQTAAALPGVSKQAV